VRPEAIRRQRMHRIRAFTPPAYPGDRWADIERSLRGLLKPQAEEENEAPLNRLDAKASNVSIPQGGRESNPIDLASINPPKGSLAAPDTARRGGRAWSPIDPRHLSIYERAIWAVQIKIVIIVKHTVIFSSGRVINHNRCCLGSGRALVGPDTKGRTKSP
jgi:hypothetical protein